VTRSRTWIAALLGLAVLVGGTLAWLARDHLAAEHSPKERGERAARDLDCWSCHREAATAPSLFGGSRAPEAIRRALRDRSVHPAISPRQETDLAAWVAVVQLEADRAGDPGAAAGPLRSAERLARRDCFGCHGELGQGGVSNPGSLKGYVPGFFGRDHDRLTRGGDPAVVREWIRDGVPGFFRTGLPGCRPALWYTERQQVRMPAYATTLSPREIEALVRYVALLRSLGPLDAEGVARYRTLRRLPAPPREP